MIRLLGKAARQLVKKEYVDSLIEALQLLSLAYRSAGLLWAARASCIFAMASIFIEAEENSDLPVSIVPTIMIFARIAVELRHLPDVLEAIRLIQGCVAGLPLDEDSQEHVVMQLTEFDFILASQLLNFTTEELQQVVQLPDVLGRLGLQQSRDALLYVLGHEAVLREDAFIKEETPESVAEFFTSLASQPASSNQNLHVIFNELKPQYYVSKVQGMRVVVHHQGSETSILAAEAIVESIEALFATAPEFHAVAHTESFSISVRENADILVPDFTFDTDGMAAIVNWPAGMVPSTYDRQEDVQRMLIGLATTLFAATCFVRDIQQTIERFFSDEAVLDRVSMIIVIGNSRQRIFRKAISTLGDWTQTVTTTFSLEPSRPNIVRRPLDSAGDDEDMAADNKRIPPQPKSHRDLDAYSIINPHLWNRAGWTGTAFVYYGKSRPPAIALMFTDEDAARKIFKYWRERLGEIDKNDAIYMAIVRGVSTDNPAHYRMLITSRLPNENSQSGNHLLTLTCRMITVPVESDANLACFLRAYEQSQAYWLMPAILQKNSSPELLQELSILKRKLSVKTASEVTERDLEVIALKREH